MLSQCIARCVGFNWCSDSHLDGGVLRSFCLGLDWHLLLGCLHPSRTFPIRLAKITSLSAFLPEAPYKSGSREAVAGLSWVLLSGTSGVMRWFPDRSLVVLQCLIFMALYDFKPSLSSDPEKERFQVGP